MSSNPKVKLSPTLEINQEVLRRWRNGETVYHLGFGESRMPLHPSLSASLCRHAHQKSYLPSLGLAELREAVADFHNRHWQMSATSDRVVIGPGSKSLIFAILLALDCHVFLPTPSWVSYAPQARLAGREVTYVKATPESDYEFTIEALVQATKSAPKGQVRILFINSPNNPTGKVWSSELLIELAKFCRQQKIIVLSDEIYALTVFNRQPHSSISNFYPEGTIVVGGPSKHLSVGGWRIGTALFPDSQLGNNLLNAIGSIASEIWSSPTAPVQYASVDAYAADAKLEKYIQSCTDLHERKTCLLCRSLTRLDIRCTEPQGAFYFVANFNSWSNALAKIGIKNSEGLANLLLDQFQLATLPGTAFGIPGNDMSIRIASSYLDMETEESSQKLMSTFLANNSVLAESDLPNSQRAVEQFSELVDYLR